MSSIVSLFLLKPLPSSLRQKSGKKRMLIPSGFQALISSGCKLLQPALPSSSLTLQPLFALSFPINCSMKHSYCCNLPCSPKCLRSTPTPGLIAASTGVPFQPPPPPPPRHTAPLSSTPMMAAPASVAPTTAGVVASGISLPGLAQAGASMTNPGPGPVVAAPPSSAATLTSGL
eukprot:scaffold291327_cov17-Tisochrysis_lutea.AAC.1